MACFWKILDINALDPSKDLAHDYAENFYGALQLLRGQGLQTVTVGQNLFASFAVLARSIVLAIVFGHVAMLVSNFNANTTNYQRKMESVFAITSKMQLPVPLRERIHQYYEHLWREYDSLDGEIVNFSKNLTCNLTLEVVLFKYMVLVMHVPFWRKCGVDFQKQIAPYLKVRVYLPDDFIIRRREVDDELFVINRGFSETPLCNNPAERENSQYTSDLFSESVLSSRTQQPDTDPDFFTQRPSFKNLTQLSRGQAFGEIALLMNYERTINVRAVSYEEMCVLTRDAFQEVLKIYPNDRRNVIVEILETFMDQNEAKRGLCPPKHMVHSVFDDGDPRKTFTTKHAALLVAEVIDPKLHDETMMFDIDDKLAHQLAAHKKGHQPDTGISPALEATFQRMEEAQAQTAEHLMQRIAHIEHTLAQLTGLVQDHVVKASGAIEAIIPQSPVIEASVSEPQQAPDAPQTPVETEGRYLLRANSLPVGRSRSASMTMGHAASLTEAQPLDPQETPLKRLPEPRWTIDALPISLKHGNLARSCFVC